MSARIDFVELSKKILKNTLDNTGLREAILTLESVKSKLPEELSGEEADSKRQRNLLVETAQSLQDKAGGQLLKNIDVLLANTDSNRIESDQIEFVRECLDLVNMNIPSLKIQAAELIARLESIVASQSLVGEVERDMPTPAPTPAPTPGGRIISY